MTHLVFEGLDRSGKSTLLSAVAAALGTAPVKMRVPKNRHESIEFYADHFTRLKRAEAPMVWDRGHLSELVYSQLYRPAEVDKTWHSMLRTTFPHLVPNVAVVYVHPGTYDLMKADEDRPGASRDAESAAFERELAQCPWQVIRVCSHELAGGSWRWRALDERVGEVLAAAGMLEAVA